MGNAEQQIDMYWPGGSAARSQADARAQRERIDAIADMRTTPATVHAERKHFRETVSLTRLLDHLDVLVDHYGRADSMTSKPVTITATQRDLLISHHDTFLALRENDYQAAEQYRRSISRIPFFYRGHPLRVPT